jgi:hypothetical protein
MAARSCIGRLAAHRSDRKGVRSEIRAVDGQYPGR